MRFRLPPTSQTGVALTTTNNTLSTPSVALTVLTASSRGTLDTSLSPSSQMIPTLKSILPTSAGPVAEVPLATKLSRNDFNMSVGQVSGRQQESNARNHSGPLEADPRVLELMLIFRLYHAMSLEVCCPGGDKIPYRAMEIPDSSFNYHSTKSYIVFLSTSRSMLISKART